MNHFLADIWNKVEAGSLGQGVIVLIVTLTIGVLVLTFITLAFTLWQKLFARKPPIADELAQHRASVAKLKEDLARLPNEEKFNKLAEQLGGLASIKQLAALEVTFDQSLKDVSAYAHKGVHDARNDFGARLTALEEAQIQRAERLAAVEADVKTLTRIVTGFDGKLDKLLEKASELRGRAERNRS